MTKYLKNKIDYGLLIALAIPILAILPLLTHHGLPNTADGPAHLMRQVELDQAWAEGNFYPRWGTDLALGHGMPIFSYAPPALYQLTQLFHLTGLPLDESLKAVLILDFLLYSLGMFLFARRIFGPYPALVAAGVYVYAPYRLREAYIQGNYGQFTGLAFYPLIFWAFHGLITDGRPRYWVATAVSLAGLLFSHNISFMIFVPTLAAYLIFLLVLTTYQQAKNPVNDQTPTAGTQHTVIVQPPRSNAPALERLYAIRRSRYALPRRSAVTRRRGAERLQPTSQIRRSILLVTPLFIRTTIAGLLGLGLSAIFWLPAFGERHDIKLEGITQGFFDFRENFITLPELLSPPLLLDLSAINPEFPLSLGLSQIIGGMTGIIALFILVRLTPHASRLTHTLFFTIFLLFYIFLTLPQSQILWETAPLIELAEFPWRMLGPAIFYASLLSAAAFSAFCQAISKYRAARITQVSLLICFLGIIVLNAPYLYPSQFLIWGSPSPADAFNYEVISGAIGTTSTGEFLPKWATQHPQPATLWPNYKAGRLPQKLDLATLPPGATSKPIHHQAELDTLQINTPQAFVATLRTLYWPGWRAYLNAQPIPMRVIKPTGLIQIPIPPGKHTLTLQLESTPLRTVGLWLTGLSLIMLIIIALPISNFVSTIPVHRQINYDKYEHVILSEERAKNLYETPHKRNQAIPHGDSSAYSHISPHFFILTTLFLLTLYFLSRPLAPQFVLQSNPNRPEPADQTLQIDFADQIRLVGTDTWPQVVNISPSSETDLKVVLYWRALQALDTNYSIFLHLDAPDGQTLATVDEVNPEDIPTRNWSPGLYLRNPLHLKIPANLPPIRYQITTGIYNRETGERLSLAVDKNTIFSLGPVWLTEPQIKATPAPIVSFGLLITLYQITLSTDTLTLLWQTTQPIAQNYSIFVHVLDSERNVLSQVDGVPYNGLYPLPNWLPHQFIKDSRVLNLQGKPDTLAIGIYDPATGQRLPAIDSRGNALLNNSYVMPVNP